MRRCWGAAAIPTTGAVCAGVSPSSADWSRRRQWAEEPAMARRYPGNELTSGLSSRLESGGTSTYTRGGVEFVLEHVSEAVVRVTHGRETGYFGLSTDPDASYPYTWTRIDHEMEAEALETGLSAGSQPLRLRLTRYAHDALRIGRGGPPAVR